MPEKKYSVDFVEIGRRDPFSIAVGDAPDLARLKYYSLLSGFTRKAVQLAIPSARYDILVSIGDAMGGFMHPGFRLTQRLAERKTHETKINYEEEYTGLVSTIDFLCGWFGGLAYRDATKKFAVPRTLLEARNFQDEYYRLKLYGNGDIFRFGRRGTAEAYYTFIDSEYCMS